MAHRSYELDDQTEWYDAECDGPRECDVCGDSVENGECRCSLAPPPMRSALADVLWAGSVFAIVACLVVLIGTLALALVR